MHYDKELFSNARKSANGPIEKYSAAIQHGTGFTVQLETENYVPAPATDLEKNNSFRKFLGYLKEFFKTSEEEMARFREYQEQKEIWLKKIEESAPKYMKAQIRTGGWI